MSAAHFAMMKELSRRIAELEKKEAERAEKEAKAETPKTLSLPKGNKAA